MVYIFEWNSQNLKVIISVDWATVFSSDKNCKLNAN